MAALPENPFDSQKEPAACVAYRTCTQLERHHSWNLATWSERPPDNLLARFTPQVCSRVLGYALIVIPRRARLAADINACRGNQELLANLAWIFMMGIIRIFKRPKGLTSPKNGPSQALTRKVVERDNYCCIVTGNANVLNACTGTQPLSARDPACGVRLVHIFTESTRSGIVGLTAAADDMLEWGGSATEVIERYTTVPIRKLDINSPENWFTVDGNTGSLFESFSISLEPIDAEQPNRYDVHTYPSGYHRFYRVPDEIMLVDATGGKVPLPDPRYIQLHHICAEVAHRSAAGSVIESILRDLEDNRFLPTDGGSHYLLSLALSFRSIVTFGDSGSGTGSGIP